jgi:hypothetical protein
VSSVSNGLYSPTLPLVSAMYVIYTSQGMSKKCWGARYTLGARYISKYTVVHALGVCISYLRLSICYWYGVAELQQDGPTQFTAATKITTFSSTSDF